MRYQIHAVNMLAKYTNLQCKKLRDYGQNRDQHAVFLVRDYVLLRMDSLLSKCLTLKVMVLLRTKMVPVNAFLLLQLAEHLREEIFNTLIQHPHKVNISLLNAALLLLNLWRQLMVHPIDVENFNKKTGAALDQLEARRAELLLVDNNRAFYDTFSQGFKTMSAK